MAKQIFHIIDVQYIMDSINDISSEISYVFLSSHFLLVLISLIVMRLRILISPTILCQIILFIMYFNDLDGFVKLPNIKFTLSFLLFLLNLVIALNLGGQTILFKLIVILYKLIVTGIMILFLFMIENKSVFTFNLIISLLIICISALIIYIWFIYGVEGDSILDMMNTTYISLGKNKNINILCLVTLLLCCNFLI